MTHYPGTRSLDAEIILNFIEGTVTMDYSLNKFGSPYESSTSTILKSEWREAKILTQIRYLIQGVLVGLFMIIVLFIQPFVTTLVEHGIIKSAKFQYHYQNLLTWCIKNTSGTVQQSQKGDLKGRVLKFTIPWNIWFYYELSGEYQDKIKSISFLRNFITKNRFGKFREEKQRGWNVVFEFTDPPRHGSATITYV